MLSSLGSAVTTNLPSITSCRRKSTPVLMLLSHLELQKLPPQWIFALDWPQLSKLHHVSLTAPSPASSRLFPLGGSRSVSWSEGLSSPNHASSPFIFQSLLWVLNNCFRAWTQYLHAMLLQASVLESLLSIFISCISPLSLLSINVTSMLKTQICDCSHQQSSDLQTHVPNPYSTSPLAIQ